jgi:hypothetical protein
MSIFMIPPFLSFAVNGLTAPIGSTDISEELLSKEFSLIRNIEVGMAESEVSDRAKDRVFPMQIVFSPNRPADKQVAEVLAKEGGAEKMKVIRRANRQKKTRPHVFR